MDTLNFQKLEEAHHSGIVAALRSLAHREVLLNLSPLSVGKRPVETVLT